MMIINYIQIPINNKIATLYFNKLALGTMFSLHQTYVPDNCIFFFISNIFVFIVVSLSSVSISKGCF